LPDTPDPFVHHPELRGRIADAETSFHRSFSVEALVARKPALRNWVHSDSRRETIRSEALAGHSGDLWIFGYGSLMWNPALRFAEVRRAHVAGHARRLILVDTRGGRGTKEAPGLFATLDAGEGCEDAVRHLDEVRDRSRRRRTRGQRTGRRARPPRRSTRRCRCG
jgi:glutathione-specific gamma-glutamylcyclotransferase